MSSGYEFKLVITLTSENSCKTCQDFLLSNYNELRFCGYKLPNENKMLIQSMFGGGNLTELLIYLQNMSDEGVIVKDILFMYHHCSGDPSKSGIVLFSEYMVSPLMVSVPSLLNSDIPQLISERFQSQTLVEFFQKGKQS